MSEVAMEFFDSRSVPHRYTMTVTVSFPPPRIFVYFLEASGDTFVFSVPVVPVSSQPEYVPVRV